MSYNPFLLSSRTVDATVPIVLTVNATVPADTAVSLLHAGDAGCAGAASSYAVVTEDHELEVALEPGVYKLCVAEGFRALYVDGDFAQLPDEYAEAVLRSPPPTPPSPPACATCC